MHRTQCTYERMRWQLRKEVILTVGVIVDIHPPRSARQGLSWRGQSSSDRGSGASVIVRPPVTPPGGVELRCAGLRGMTPWASMDARRQGTSEVSQERWVSGRPGRDKISFRRESVRHGGQAGNSKFTFHAGRQASLRNKGCCSSNQGSIPGCTRARLSSRPAP